MSEKNMEKYETYRIQSIKLKKAMKSGNYYEAVFIEYAIFEDRIASVLKNAGVDYHDKDGKDIAIRKKLSKLKGRKEFHDDYIRKRISVELIDKIDTWIEMRNKLIHKLLNMPYDNDEIRSFAESGEELVRELKNKSSSVNRYLQRGDKF